MSAKPEMNRDELEKVSKQKGGFTVNKMLQNELNRLLAKDTSADLQQWLDKSVSSYATNGSKAIDYALRQNLATPASSRIGSGPTPPRFLAKAVPSTSELKVVQEVQSIVQVWASKNGPNKFPEGATEEQLLLQVFTYQCNRSMGQ